MERQFQNQLDEIKNLLLNMGGAVEQSLAAVAAGLVSRDIKKLDRVHEIEKKINQVHLEVDAVCTNFLAKQGPVASDLRFIVSVLKINSDLERMGDQCVNISYLAKEFIGRSGKYPLEEINTMSSVAQKMVKESLDCFVRRDLDLAKKVLLTDDDLDTRKKKIFDVMTSEIKKDPSHVESALELILIARNLERIGDHATNIAEDVIYFSTGKDVRHGKYD